MQTDHANKYTDLICSLPACQELFSAKFTPVSRIQLEKRLRVLDEEDYQDMQLLGNFLDWFRQPLNRSDTELLTIVRKNYASINSASIRHYIDWRLEFRTLIAALRQKHRGGKFSSDAAWGYGRWVQHVEKHWHEKYFALEKIQPWLVEVDRLLGNEQALELERFILAYVWRWLEKESFGHEFDFEAVAIYRMRWDLVARWTSYTKAPAQQRFQQLLDAAMSAA